MKLSINGYNHFTIPKQLNIQKCIQPFIAAQDVGPTSRITYDNAMRQFCLWYKAKRIKQPTRETILSYKYCLDQKNLSSFTKATYLVIVRLFFLWTEESGLYPNIARGIKGIKRQLKNHQKDSLTLHAIKSLLGSINQNTLLGKRDFALINLLIRTGLRLKELAYAIVTDLQEQRGEMVLWVRGKGRSGKDEFVILTKEALDPVLNYLRARKLRHDNVPLFASLSDRNYGKQLTTHSLSRIIKNYLRKAGFNSKRITAHSLRHTFGVLAMQAGASLYEVQLAMRHAAPTTTQLYLGDIERIKRLEASPERKISALLDAL